MLHLCCVGVERSEIAFGEHNQCISNTKCNIDYHPSGECRWWATLTQQDNYMQPAKGKGTSGYGNMILYHGNSYSRDLDTGGIRLFQDLSIHNSENTVYG